MHVAVSQRSVGIPATQERLIDHKPFPNADCLLQLVSEEFLQKHLLRPRFRPHQVAISLGFSEIALGNNREKNTCLKVSYPRRIRFKREMWSRGMQLPKKLCFNTFVFRVVPTNQMVAYLKKTNTTEFIILEIWNRICNVISVAGSLLLVKIFIWL